MNFIHYTKSVEMVVFNMAKVENIKVFGIEDSFRASKSPFATDINAVND